MTDRVDTSNINKVFIKFGGDQDTKKLPRPPSSFDELNRTVGVLSSLGSLDQLKITYKDPDMQEHCDVKDDDELAEAYEAAKNGKIMLFVTTRK